MRFQKAEAARWGMSEVMRGMRVWPGLPTNMCGMDAKSGSARAFSYTGVHLTPFFTAHQDFGKREDALMNQLPTVFPPEAVI